MPLPSSPGESERRTGRKAQGVFVPLAALESRAVNTTVTAPEIVPTIHRADQYIEPFRNNLLARRLGVRVLSGLIWQPVYPQVRDRRHNGMGCRECSAAYWRHDFRQRDHGTEYPGGIQEMSRQLLQQSSPDVEALVRNDLSFLLAQAIDSALIKGGGTNEPTGVLSTVGVQTANLATLRLPDGTRSQRQTRLVRQLHSGFDIFRPLLRPPWWRTHLKPRYLLRRWAVGAGVYRS